MDMYMRMSMYMYMYMYIRTHIIRRIFFFVWVGECTQTHSPKKKAFVNVSIYVQTLIQLQKYIYTHVCVCRSGKIYPHKLKCTHMCTYTYTYRYRYACRCTYTCIHVCAGVSECTHTHAKNKHKCPCTCTHTYRYQHSCRCAWTHFLVCLEVGKYTHTHSNTQTCIRVRIHIHINIDMLVDLHIHAFMCVGGG